MEGDAAYDEYSWPWVADEEVNGDQKIKSLRPANRYIHGSYAMLYAEYTPNAPGETLAFDYKLGTEKTDILFVIVETIRTTSLACCNPKTSAAAEALNRSRSSPA